MNTTNLIIDCSMTTIISAQNIKHIAVITNHTFDIDNLKSLKQTINIIIDTYPTKYKRIIDNLTLHDMLRLNKEQYLKQVYLYVPNNIKIIIYKIKPKKEQYIKHVYFVCDPNNI